MNLIRPPPCGSPADWPRYWRRSTWPPRGSAHSRPGGGAGSAGVYWLHLIAFVAYNASSFLWFTLGLALYSALLAVITVVEQ